MEAAPWLFMASFEQPVTGTGTGTVTGTYGDGRERDTGEPGSNRHASPACVAHEVRREGPGYLPHERLEVYRVALELHQALSAALPRRCARELRDQLFRASTSVVLNVAEGAGRTSLADKRRFYEIAKGSATESAAVLDLVRLHGGGDATHRARASELAIRVVQMLTRLCAGPR